MRSVDTNVVARFLLGDDPAQSLIAENVLGDGAFISLTVLLEISWLLRSRYKLTPVQISALINVLREHIAIKVEGEEWLDWLLDSFVQGRDFADLIHLIASKHLQSFATFDRDIERYAQAGSPVKIEIL